MKTTSKVVRRTVCSFLAGLMLVSYAVCAAPEPPSLDAFFSNSTIAEVELSPDGKFASVVGAGTDGRLKLAVMDLSDHSMKLIAGYGDADIVGVHWINDHRLVYTTTQLDMAAGDDGYSRGLYARDRDGKNGLLLSARNYAGKQVLSTRARYFAHDPKMTSDKIYVLEPTPQSANLILFDTVTRQIVQYERPAAISNWLLDGEGEPRIAVGHADGRAGIYYRNNVDWKWNKIADFNAYNGNGFRPIAFGADGKLYVVASRGSDTNAVYRYDPATRKMEDEPLISIKGYDFNGSLLFNQSRDKVVGIRYLTDAWSTVWLDDAHKNLQAAIDKLLPGTNNTLQFAQGDVQSDNVLVDAYSDVQPLAYWIYSRSTGKLFPIGSSHPQIDSKQMSYQDMVHYPARDGLDIPAYLTLPKGGGKKNLPLIVFVHGGPWLRDVWGWDPEVQFLASRGYAVLQPEYRGSVGFGFKHFQSGWRQWGQSMQDDLADGVKWAVSQGIADPKRVCIMGASYGGYATLVGLAKQPELYRCGVEWVGVTDIDLMYQPLWDSDASAEYQHYGMPILIGDRDKDAAMLKANSPVNLADRIKQPLLMAAGGADSRVPIEHGKAMRDAIKSHNDKAEWIYYWNEGHGWRLVQTRLDFWDKVEKFLDTNLKQAQ